MYIVRFIQANVALVSSSKSSIPWTHTKQFSVIGKFIFKIFCLKYRYDINTTFDMKCNEIVQQITTGDLMEISLL